MTDKKTKALKLALEANTALREWVNAVPMGTPLPAMPGIDGDWLDSVDATIREALAEQQEPGRNHYEDGDVFERIAAMKRRTTQQEPVAWLIDSNYTTVFRDIAEHHRNKGAKVEPLYTSPPEQPQEEPVETIREVIGCFDAALAEGLQEALAETTDERLKDLVERRLMHALYAAQNASPSPPAQHPRVGLTDGEIRLIMDGRGAEGDDNYVEPVFDPFGVDDHSLFAFARAIEAKHGIKERP